MRRIVKQSMSNSNRNYSAILLSFTEKGERDPNVSNSLPKFKCYSCAIPKLDKSNKINCLLAVQ